MGGHGRVLGDLIGRPASRNQSEAVFYSWNARIVLVEHSAVRNQSGTDFGTIFQLETALHRQTRSGKRKRLFLIHFFVFTAVFYSSSQSDPSKTAEKKTTDSHSRLEIALQNETRTENDFSSFLFFFAGLRLLGPAVTQTNDPWF